MKSDTPEMARFNAALRSVMKVTKPELTAMLNNDEALESVRLAKGPRPKPPAPKPSSSVRALRTKV